MTAIVWILAISLCVAIGLIAVGLRGYRVGDHTVCRRCGFDLFGTPSAQRCGECGADLTEDCTTAVGHYHRRNGFLVTGICLLVVSAGVGGSQVVSIDLRYAPEAYLLWQSVSPQAETRSAVLAEIGRRNAAGALSESDWDRIAGRAIDYRNDSAKPWDDAWGGLMRKGREDHRLSDAMWEKYLVCLAHQAFFGIAARRSDAEKELYQYTLDGLLNEQAVQAVADEVLAYQALPGGAWEKHWGDWLESAEATRQLSAEQWKRYLTNAWRGAFSLRVRARVRQGDPLPFSFDFGALRGGVDHAAGPRMYLSHIQVRWNGLPAEELTPKTIPAFYWQLDQHFERLRYVLPDGFPASVQPGKQQIHLTATVEVWTNEGESSKRSCESTGQIDIPAAFTLLPSDQPSVKIVNLPKWQASIQRDIEPYLGVEKRYPGSLYCSMHVVHPPFGLAFDVYLRIKGRSTRIGSLACAANSEPGWQHIGWGEYSQGDGPVDVSLRSSKSVAIESLDTYEVWQGTLVFKNVEVRSR